MAFYVDQCCLAVLLWFHVSIERLFRVKTGSYLVFCLCAFAGMESFKKKKSNQQKKPQKNKALLFIVVAVALTPR